VSNQYLQLFKKKSLKDYVFAAI